MKLASLMILIVLLSGCGGLPTKIKSPFSIPEKTAPETTSPTVIATEPSPPPNFDDEFQKNLSKIWGDYFIENYSETRAIDVLVITNRKLKTPNFGCTNDNLGVIADVSTHFG